VFSISVNGQINNKLALSSLDVKHTYYVDVKQVATKAICLTLENNIAKKSGVISFKTVGFPSKYFVLKANSVIKQSDLNSWLQENGIEMAFFVEGKAGLEELFYRKNKK
jgi:16S rRNA U516 pseudouridylate synthase RsuA-like enzyme